MTEEEGKRWGGQSEDCRESGQETQKTTFRKSFVWNQEEENPFRRKAGIRKFREIYTGKRRNDRTAWSDYFVSADFLEGYREGRFAQLLLETVQENQETYGLSKGFLTELSIAYGVLNVRLGDSLQLQVENNAYFYGIEYIYEIVQMSSSATRFRGNDYAMLAGFRDYRELLMLAVSDWDDDTLLKLGSLIDHYILHNLSDRPIKNAEQYELSQRHPKSLKLITYFFSAWELPKKVCQVLWNHLRLENATLGKEKLFYGALREEVLARVPGLGEKPRPSYKELLREFNNYDTGSGYYNNGGRTPEERQKMDRFFERSDVAEALNDAAFVEEQVLRYWITKSSGIYLLKKLHEYYAVRPEAPFAERVLRQIDGMSQYRQVETEFEEDRHSALIRGNFDFQKRSYVRYYLNTAFHLARGIQNHILLRTYLEEWMPYSPEWGRKLSAPEIGGFSPENPIRIWFGKDELQIFFFPKHIEYRWNGSMQVPFYPGEELAGIEDECMFWLLVPVAAASIEQQQKIRAELMKRLSLLPVRRDDIPVIADCITGYICRIGKDAIPVCSFYAEKEDHLYGCDIYNDFNQKIYEETAGEKLYLPNGSSLAPDMEAALQMGKRFLEELVTEKQTNTSMQLLPEHVLAEKGRNMIQTFSGMEITEKTVSKILSQYFEGNLSRVELAWTGRSLLFIKSEQQYACFYFEHDTQNWYALVSMPEVYFVVESDDVIYKPFALGMLPDYLIHPNPNHIMKELKNILAQIARENPCPKSMMWSPQIYRFETRQRYRLAKRQFGGYPEDQTQNQIQDRFYIPRLPEYLCYTDLEGNSSGKKAVLKNKAKLQQILLDYMAGRLSQLVLVWQHETGKAYEGIVIRKRCIMLRQDQGNHMLIWLEDGSKGMEYLVSDVNEYLNDDGKKYRKVFFEGKSVPGYLIHTDMRRIRNCLDLLIPQMQYELVNNGGFGEFSYESGGEYEKIKSDLDRMDRESDTPL